MAIKFVPIKCPQCNATFSIESGRKEGFCAYCGTKILIDNGRDYEHTYRRVDEAAIKRAEAAQLVRLKELELEEQKIRNERLKHSRKIGLIIFIIAIYACAWIAFGIFGSFFTPNVISENKDYIQPILLMASIGIGTLIMMILAEL